jgi:hypothetical protein
MPHHQNLLMNLVLVQMVHVIVMRTVYHAQKIVDPALLVQMVVVIVMRTVHRAQRIVEIVVILNAMGTKIVRHMFAIQKGQNYLGGHVCLVSVV